MAQMNTHTSRCLSCGRTLAWETCRLQSSTASRATCCGQRYGVISHEEQENHHSRNYGIAAVVVFCFAIIVGLE